MVSIDLMGDQNREIAYKSYGGYNEREFIALFKNFYEMGNLNIPEEKRHRRVK